MKKLIICTLIYFVLLLFNNNQIVTAKQKIVMWDIQVGGVLKEKIDSIVKEYNEKNADYEIEVVHIQNDPFKTKLKVAMGAGSPPDIFHNWGGGPLKEYIDANMVASIDAIKSDLLKRYIPAAFDPVTFDGKTYGLPYAGLTGVYFWYRKDIFAKYKLTPPKTWKEFLKVCDVLKRNGITPLSLANKTKWTGSFYFMYLADRLGGGDMFVNALYRKNDVTFNDPSFEKAGEMLQYLVKKDYFVKGFNGMDEDTGQSRALIYSGKAGMYLMGNWFLGNAKKEAPEIVSNIDFFTFPAVEDGKGDPTDLVGSPGQNYFSVSNVSKVKDAAMKFLNDNIMTPSYIEYLAKSYVPPVKGSSDYVSDPIMKKIAKTFEAAKHVQAYYDQYLPPEMAEKHKDIVQSLFGLDITPKQAAAEHEKAFQAIKK